MDCRVLACICVSALQISWYVHGMDAQPSPKSPRLTAEQAKQFVPYLLAKHPTHNVIAAAVRNPDDETDACLGLYDAKTRNLLALFESAQTVDAPTCIAYSPDGSMLTVGNKGGYVQCWRVFDEKLQCSNYQLAKRIEDIAWNAASTHLAVLGRSQEQQKILIMDGKTFEVLREMQPKAPLCALSYSPTVLEPLATLSSLYINKTRQSSVDVLAISKDATQTVSQFKASGVRLGKLCYSTKGNALALAGAEIMSSGPSRKSNACIYVLNMLRENTYAHEKLPNASGERVIALKYALRAGRFICCTNEGIIALYTADGHFTNSTLCSGNGSCAQIADCAIVKDEAKNIELALATSKGLKNVTVEVKEYEPPVDVGELIKKASTEVWNFFTK